MARRKKDSPLEDFVALVALAPWWVGCLLALLAYLGLHAVASQPSAVIVQPGQVAPAVTQILWKTFAGIGQYIVPLLCLVAAGVSASRRQRRQNLVAHVAHSEAPDALNSMGWQEFEMLVGEAFRLKGFQVSESGGGGADGGIDLVLRKDGEKHLVQCKQWKAYKVGVSVVRELYGVMAAQGAAGGYVVTSGRFTDEARAFAQGRNIQLIEGSALHALIQQAQVSRGQRNRVTEKQPPSSSSSLATPACPLCAQPMALRTAKRGASSGNQFWGCVGFPSCRGTRKAD